MSFCLFVLMFKKDMIPVVVVVESSQAPEDYP